MYHNYFCCCLFLFFVLHLTCKRNSNVTTRVAVMCDKTASYALGGFLHVSHKPKHLITRFYYKRVK